MRPTTTGKHQEEATGGGQGQQLTANTEFPMATKQIMFQDAALLEMKKGVDRLAEAVKCTMGPAGRHVAIEKSYGGPQLTKDGVSVSKEISLAEPFESMGAKMVNEVAKKTADKAGDGTTAATVLAQAIYSE